MKIGDRPIGVSAPPFVIAEMSGNHNQSLDRALEIVEAAASAGAHALKLQTYTPETMTLDVSAGDFFVSDQASLWKGKSLYELYQLAYTPWEWHRPIFDLAADLGMVAFSSPFDETAVEFLETLEVPAYKIASFENADLPLIRKVAQTGKPVIISTGMATLSELDESVRTLRQYGSGEIVLLKCTSTYPATAENSNVFTIPHMKSLFGCEVGLSDHTMGCGAAIAAVAHGASVVEKHFTLRRADGGVDSAFSVEPEEMKQLVIESKRAWQSLGAVSYGPQSSETGSVVFRRSLYVVADMESGDVFTPDNLRIIRPGKGLAPKYYEVFLGRTVNRKLARGSAVQWDMIG